MKRMKMPSSAMSDHMSRLYDGDNHVDKNGAVIRVVRVLKQSLEIDISDEAIADFLNDMDYQIEFNEGEYKSSCRYAYKKMKQNLLQN
jgi:hypothetical protein